MIPKICTKCMQMKDTSEFGKNRTRSDGLRAWCKDCECKYARKYYKKNRDTVKKYNNYDSLHRVIEGVRQKLCGKCKKWKAESDFYKRCSNKDGLAVYCKECSNKATNQARKRRLK